MQTPFRLSKNDTFTRQWLFTGAQYNRFPFNQEKFQQGLLQLADGINSLNKSNKKN